MAMGTPFQAYSLGPPDPRGAGGGVATPWIVTVEERAQYEQIFQSLSPISGKITGNQAKSYLVRSGLPENILAQIWALSDVDKDGKMTAQEFSIAMRLIQCRRQGLQLPAQLPPTMLTSATGSFNHPTPPVQPMGMMGGRGGGFSVSHSGMPMFGTLPGRRQVSSPKLSRAESFQHQRRSGVAPQRIPQRQPQKQADWQDIPWPVPAATKMKCNQIFNANDRMRSGFLSGPQAKALLMQTGLAQELLVQIWRLADIDNDGRLSNEEFAVAMYLVDEIKAGKTLSAVLPMELVPPSMRRKSMQMQQQRQQQAAAAVSASAAGDLMNSGKADSVFPVYTRTYEDRKRENFERGRLELEKRKQERKEKERKEKEEKERKLREEMGRKEREREEERRKAEERRLAELEEERQRDLELLKLEQDQDYQAKMQRQAAQREMELAREREWQKKRKEELEGSKAKVMGEVSTLRQQLRSLMVELETLTQRQRSMLSMLENNRVQMGEGRTVLLRLSQSRDSRTEELSRLQGELKTASERLGFLTDAKGRLKDDLRRKGHTPEVAMWQSVKDQRKGKQEEIARLKLALQQQQELIAGGKRELLAHHVQLEELKESEETMTEELNQHERLLAIRNQGREDERRKSAAEARWREDEAQRRREEAERWRKETEEALRQEEDLRKQREDEARLQAAEQREAMLKEQLEKQRREEEKARLAEESRRRELEAYQKGQEESRRIEEEAERNRQAKIAKEKEEEAEKRRARSLSPQGEVKQKRLSVAEKALARRSELDDDAERRTKDFEERMSKHHEVRQRVEMLQQKKRRMQDVKVRQEQETAAATKAAEEAKRREQEQRRHAAERARLEREAEANKQAEEKARQKALEQTQLKEAARKEQEAEAKRSEIEARKQALLAKKERLLAEKRAAASAAVTAVRVNDRLQYRALYDFSSRGEEELDFKEGDTILGVSGSATVEAGWLKGELNGKVGLVPLNYVSKIDVTASPASQRKAAVLAKASSSTHPVPTPRPKARAPAPPTAAARPMPRPRQISPLATATFVDDIYSVPPPRVRRRATSPAEVVAASRRSQPFSAPCSPTSRSPPSNDESEWPDGRLQRQGSSHFRVVALYGWSGQEDDHLTFNKDDTITVLNQNDMWYKGRLAERTGWFPKSYVKLIGGRKAQSLSSLEPATLESAIAESQEESEESGPVQPEEYVAIYGYSGEGGDLSFKAGDLILVTEKGEEWWTGKIGHKTGIFPATYVQKKGGENGTKGSAGAKLGDVRLAPGALTRPSIATVIAKYEATGQEQLSLSPGQLVHVRKQNPNGWWEGELQARGKKKKGGWFPSNRVKLLGNPNDAAAARQAKDLRPPSKENGSQAVAQPPPTSFPARPTSPMAEPSPTIGDVRVLAIYSYVANNDDELSFTKGNVITVTSKEGEWWKGDLNGHVGVFPSNYVQPLSELHTPTTAKWSDSIEPLVLESLDDMERKRQEAIFELIQTEQSHCDALHLVKELFYDPVNEMNILEPEAIQDIFVNWNELIMCSDYFLKTLRVRQKTHEAEPIDLVGDILCEQVPRLTSFIRFCSRQMNAIGVLQSKASKADAFKELETKMAQDARTGGLPLSSFLLRPMQRVTKYPLLVSKILQYTPDSHADHVALSDAVKKAEDLCSQVNEGVRMQENSDRLEWLQINVNVSSLEEKVVFNSQTNSMGPRRFLHSGNLKKARSGRELYAVLFNDFLMFMKPVTKNAISAMFDSSDHKYEIYRRPIFLDNVQVKSALTEQFGDDSCFHVGFEQEKIMSLRADNHTESNAWVKKIRDAVRQYQDAARAKQQQEKEAIAKEKDRPSAGTLTVTVVEATNLQSADLNGKSDPFCEVRMGTQVHRTQVIERCLNPKWNAKMMVFYVKDLNKDRVCFTVFDRDIFSPSDYLGRAELQLFDLLRDGSRGSWGKWLVLKEVSTGELHVKLTLKVHPRARSH